MRIIKNSKELTTLQVGDKVLFGDLEYKVHHNDGYFLYGLGSNNKNDKIFTILGLHAIDFVKNLGIEPLSVSWIFPEVKSLEVLTAIVSALFKEYEKQNELPKTWEEFCKRNPIKKEECWIECFNGEILKSAGTKIEGKHRDPEMDKNLCTSEQEAEAFLALMQLHQLRKCYIGNWEPDWNCSPSKFCIIVDVNKIRVSDYCFVQKSLSFPTSNLAKQFLTNFKDLLEIAKPLL